MRFSLANVGCKVNRVEIDGIAAQLIEGGAQLSDAAEADIVIINTCTVTAEADKKTRKAIRQALRKAPQAYVLVTGCAAAIDPDSLRALDSRVRVLGKAQVVSAAWELVGDESVPGSPDASGAGDISGSPSSPAGSPASLRMGEGFRTRVGIKIQDGCNNACTYCIVHVARGLPVSVPASQIEAEVHRYAQAGARELVLTGINLGTYDDGGLALEGLVKQLLPLIPDGRLRLSSIEPCDVSEGLVNLLSREEGRVCRHLHLPLQSGSSRVLEQMNRPYTAEWFIDLVEHLRSRVPGMALSTDIIVGFPGETEDDFRQTLDLARAARFSKIHVFRYSRRAGTPAAARSDQVSADVAADRAHRLAELGRELAMEDARARAGTIEYVLVESGGRGTSESYHSVQVPDAFEPGRLVPLPIMGVSSDGRLLC